MLAITNTSFKNLIHTNTSILSGTSIYLHPQFLLFTPHF